MPELKDEPQGAPSPPAGLARIIKGADKQVDSLTIRRLIPQPDLRSVGPFVFMDHMGPTQLAPGEALDVRPHPHINLATVTYLFEGAITHRDSLGHSHTIEPGAINLMTAGRGIAHSERSPRATRQLTRPIHGLQFWCALSIQDEECDPAFEHFPASEFPAVPLSSGSARILLGQAFGQASKVRTSLRTLLVELKLSAGQMIDLQLNEEEWGLYPLSGPLTCGGSALQHYALHLANQQSQVKLEAESDCHVMILGGDALKQRRHLFWNFISTRRERIEQAKQDWLDQKFGTVFEDENEFIPLP